ncbi:MAG: DUF2283 domain-containing protein [Nitrososphaerota archaeon]|nr:DUF2283 domain-containing protein [Nitrososphaerota archaeon]
MKYDSDADVLSVMLKEKGKLSHAEEVGDVILHVDKEGRPLFFEVLNASKVVPKMVQAMARGEIVA